MRGVGGSTDHGAANRPGDRQDKLTKVSLVFVRASAATREGTSATGVSQAVLLDRGPEFNGLPTGTRLVARLPTPVNTAIKAPLVAAIAYNYKFRRKALCCGSLRRRGRGVSLLVLLELFANRFAAPQILFDNGSYFVR